MTGRPRNKNRDFAALNGDRFYEGSACWCGNTRRYTKGGRCVECAISQARTQSAKQRKPKMATPEQQRLAAPPIPTRPATAPSDAISQQIAEMAAAENAKAAEETAKAEKIAAINRIETGGMTLCGTKVSSSEMAEYVRTGIVPPRILAQHKGDEE